MKMRKAIVFGCRVKAFPRLEVNDFHHTVVMVRDSEFGTFVRECPPAPRGRSTGIVYLDGGRVVCDIHGVAGVGGLLMDKLRKLLLELLAELIWEVFGVLVPTDPDDHSPDSPERRAWDDEEEYRRVRAEVERAASEALPTTLIPATASAGDTPEPVAWTQDQARHPYDPEKDAVASGNDSLTLMGFRTARGIHKGKGVKVAVLDTGCRRSHPAIPATVREVIDCTGRGGGEQDPNGHGTFCVSQIVGTGPKSDPIGTAPECTVMPIQVLDSRQGWGADSWIARGVDTAVRLGAHVISMSLGGTAPMPLTEAAIGRAYEKGVVICAAAGNGGHAETRLAYPAAYTECIQVGACDDTMRAASFSQAQDGVDVYACGVCQVGATGADSYGAWDGTSMATPHIAGAVALYLGWVREVHGDYPHMGIVADALAESDVRIDYTRGGTVPNSRLVQADDMLTGVKVPVPVDPTPTPTPTPTPVPHTIEWTDTRVGFALMVGELSAVLADDPSALVQFRLSPVKPSRN